MFRLRCSFFRALSNEASLSRRLCGDDEAFDGVAFDDAVLEVALFEDAVLEEVALLAASFSSLLAFAIGLLLPIRLKEWRVYLDSLEVICG
jgi:hypothetical protein